MGECVEEERDECVAFACDLPKELPTAATSGYQEPNVSLQSRNDRDGYVFPLGQRRMGEVQLPHVYGHLEPVRWDLRDRHEKVRRRPLGDAGFPGKVCEHGAPTAADSE